ncbi:hypothetical protein KDA_44810 [Dictyobacter alpinus]|uniref:Uncharacterized protein n=2 Tax=Dictyobacter alpinus TaxID=2014873 RepID=A0A402BCI3_9CHLR|nr:hypothetical protein KDA_44810 [Dictyobacter alpinus]
MNTSSARKRALAFSTWLYGLFLYAYPATFRRDYGARMVRVFRDSCSETLQQHGMASLGPLWLHTIMDLLLTASLERWSTLKEKTHAMTTLPTTQHVPPRLWIALAATLLAFMVSLVASLNLYLIEDSSPLTRAAYTASPLLRFSYAGIYLSALVAGVAICAIAGYVLIQRVAIVRTGLVIIALVVMLGGFGGLLVRHPQTFLIYGAIFTALLLLNILLEQTITRHTTHPLGPRPARILGACVSAGSILLINVILLVLHTLLLNPVSHALYMQGQIGATHFNFTLISMVLAFLTIVICTISLGSAFRLSSLRS